MRVRLIGCEVLCRELCAAIADAPLIVDAEFLPKGLHDQGALAMRSRLQEAIDHTDPVRYQAVLLGYALCGTGTAGLVAREIPVVLPRAHDCIAMLLGSRTAYDRLFAENSGTYFRSPGWVERGGDLLQLSRNANAAESSLESLIARYGEDNGRYLFEELHHYRSHYSRLVYIDTGVGSGHGFQDSAKAEALRKGWSFEMHPGSLSWFQKLFSGTWDEDFLVLQPGESSEAVYDGEILRAKEATG